MEVTVPTVAAGVMVLAVVLLAVTRVRRLVPGLDRFHIPSSLVAGAVLVLFGPHVAGLFIGEGAGLVPPAMFHAWSTLPGLLINVVFAGLLLGKRLPSLREVWDLGAPQALFGQTIAWGQYVVGIGITMLILEPVFDLPIMTGALIEMGFQGGHGIADGLRETFADLGFPDGIALTNGLATWGVVFGVVVGTMTINLAERFSDYKTIRERFGDGNETKTESPPVGSEPDNGEHGDSGGTPASSDDSSVDPLAAALGWVFAAVALGWLMQAGLGWIERTTYGPHTEIEILRYVPLFPLAMVGGLVIQFFVQRTGHADWVDRRYVARIADTALDFTVLSAVATLGLQTIGDHWEAFVILAVAGTLWCVFALLVLARRMMDENWLERGVCDFGQSMGMTAVGLLLVRIADPNNRTRAVESFGYKQLFFEPFVGGGFVTTASLPLLAHLGPWPLFGVSIALCLGCMVSGILFFGPRAARHGAQK